MRATTECTEIMDELFTQFEQQLDRMKTAAGVQHDSALAGVLGISSGAITNARARDVIPKKWFTTIVNKFNVARTWLVSGKGPMYRDAEAPAPAGAAIRYAEKPTTKIVQTDIKFTNVPVMGLAVCGLSDWFNPRPVAVHASVPDDVGRQAFGVIAVGESMQPQGIEQGFVAICDPDVELMQGDVVYVEQKDPRTGNDLASLKKFIKTDDTWIYLKSWLPPDENGEQKSVVSQLSLDIVKRVIPVTLIRRRL